MALFARDINTIHYGDPCLNDDKFIATMRENILQGDIYIIKNFIEKKILQKIRNYLINIGSSSLPNYYPLLEGCPNFHRLNHADERAYVKGTFYQFSFLPWNQDMFGLFDLFKEICYLKNRLGEIESRDRFLSATPDDDCVMRIVCQNYPAGGGSLNPHSDPIDYHQITVPILTMSKKGEDFRQGGAYVVRPNKEKVILDDIVEWGDVTYTNAQVIHGVEPIDPDEELDWLSFRGRWMFLFVINKLSAHDTISNPLDYKSI